MGSRSSPTSPGGLIPEPKEKLNANPDAVYELLGIKWNDRKKMQVCTASLPLLSTFYSTFFHRYDWIGREESESKQSSPWEAYLMGFSVPGLWVEGELGIWHYLGSA